MSEPLWRGLTHQQVYGLVHAGPGPYVSDAAITAWSDAQTALRSIDADLAAAMAKAGDWEGAAADATRGGLTPLGSWAVGAAHAAERAAITVQQHQEQVATVRAALPEPGPDPNGLSPFSFKGPGTAPREVQAVANAELAAQAFHVMDTYAANTGLIQHWAPPWAAPPTVTVAVADPATPHTVGPAGATSRTGRHAADPGVAAATSVAGVAAGAGGLIAGTGGMRATAAVDASGTASDGGGVGGTRAEVGAAQTGDGGEVSARLATNRGAGATGVAGAGAGVDGSGIGAAGVGAAGVGAAGISTAGFDTGGGQGGGARGVGRQDGAAAGGGPVGPPSMVSTKPEGTATVASPGSSMKTWRDLPDLARTVDGPGLAGSGRPTTDGGAAPGLRNGTGNLFGKSAAGRGVMTEGRAGLPDAGGGTAADPVSGRGARLSGDPLGGGTAAGTENPAARPSAGGSGYMPMTGGGTGGEGHAHRRPPFLLDNSGAFADHRWFSEAVITPDDPLPSA